MWTSERLLSGALRWAGIACCALALAGLVRAALAVPPLEPPRYGARGRRRLGARSQLAFRLIEPAMSHLGAWLEPLLRPDRRLAVERWLHVAGDVAGLSADELVALSVLAGAGGAGIALGFELGPGGALSLVAAAASWPLLRVRAVAHERAKALERSLPMAMDLCALCMGAGSDFPAALQFVAVDLGAAHAVCREELTLVLDELRLGRTRVEALSALAERTASRAVREFVGAVCQSEQEGTPLVDVLAIQASSLRQRRSVRAEELAAQAGVKMMLPLALMMASLMLVVFGPFLVRGVGL